MTDGKWRRGTFYCPWQLLAAAAAQQLLFTSPVCSLTVSQTFSGLRRRHGCVARANPGVPSGRGTASEESIQRGSTAKRRRPSASFCSSTRVARHRLSPDTFWGPDKNEPIKWNVRFLKSYKTISRRVKRSAHIKYNKIYAASNVCFIAAFIRSPVLWTVILCFTHVSFFLFFPNSFFPTSANRHFRNFSTWRGFTRKRSAAMPIS